MKNTKNYSLLKPDGEDFYNVEDFNSNADVIDTELKKNAESVNNLKDVAKTGNASDTTVTFTQAGTRTNLTSGEKLSISFGKIKKWFSDLKTVAFTGSYNDLSNKPASFPANGGNADTVDGKHASDLQNYNNLTNKPVSMPANGGNSDTVDGKHAADLQNYNNLTNKPAALKNPYSLTMQFNGSTQKMYDGSSSQTLNITPSGIGAAAGSHTHANEFFSNTGNLGAPIIDTAKIPLLSDINKSCCLYILNGKGTCSDAPADTSGYCITITGNGNRKQMYLNWADAVIYQRLKTGSNQYTAWTKINDSGNADTVDGYHAYQFQNLGNGGTPEATHLKSEYDNSKGRFYLKAYKDSGEYINGVYVDYSANSDRLQDKRASDFVSDSPAGGRNYTTVLEWALAQSNSVLCFSSSGSNLSNAADKPSNGQYGQFSYFLLKGEGNRRTVLAVEYGATGKNIYRRCLDGTSWYDSWIKISDGGNADKLSGKDVSQFISMGNEINSNTDFNTILTSGFYNVRGNTLLSSARHQPPNAYQYGILIVADAKPYAKVQVYYSHRNEIWTRVTYGNADGFTSWVKTVTNEMLYYSANEPGSIAEGCTVMLPE